jgi:hypothetical protein
MLSNEKVGTCGDYYCDAQAVCGVQCAEIDIQENNRFAWASTFHAADDHWGRSVGYGGGGENWSGPRDFTDDQYGPYGRCVNTELPFQVRVSFPVGSNGYLQGMLIELSQEGMPCTIKMNLSNYDGNHSTRRNGSRYGMKQMTQAISKGMTPIISYWESEDMMWLDGNGSDGKGPCGQDLELPCGKSVSFYDFSLEDLESDQADQGTIVERPEPPERRPATPASGGGNNSMPAIFLFLGGVAAAVSAAAVGLWFVQQRRGEPLLVAE